jgi:hypothetical protein
MVSRTILGFGFVTLHKDFRFKKSRFGYFSQMLHARPAGVQPKRRWLFVTTQTLALVKNIGAFGAGSSGVPASDCLPITHGSKGRVFSTCPPLTTRPSRGIKGFAHLSLGGGTALLFTNKVYHGYREKSTGNIAQRFWF